MSVEDIKKVMAQYDEVFDHCDSVYTPCEEFRIAANDMYYILREIVTWMEGEQNE